MSGNYFRFSHVLCPTVSQTFHFNWNMFAVARIENSVGLVFLVEPATILPVGAKWLPVIYLYYQRKTDVSPNFRLKYFRELCKFYFSPCYGAFYSWINLNKYLTHYYNSS